MTLINRGLANASHKVPTTKRQGRDTVDSLPLSIYKMWAT